MDKGSYQSKSDSDIYVLGDCMSYTFPTSAQITSSKICANYVNSRLRGEKEVLELPGNIYYSFPNFTQKRTTNHNLLKI